MEQGVLLVDFLSSSKACLFLQRPLLSKSLRQGRALQEQTLAVGRFIITWSFGVVSRFIGGRSVYSEIVVRHPRLSETRRPVCEHGFSSS